MNINEEQRSTLDLWSSTLNFGTYEDRLNKIISDDLASASMLKNALDAEKIRKNNEVS
jgi:hypothetical protein